MNNRKETSCSCNSCKAMCLHSPCFPTPKDVEKLVAAGLKDALTISMFCDGAIKGFNQEEYWMVVAPRHVGHIEKSEDDVQKACIFLDMTTKLCLLHDAGLKPTEGKLAIHGVPDDGLRAAVCRTWDSLEGEKLFLEFGLPEEGILTFRNMRKERGIPARLLAASLLSLI